jgi:hypothetical protein
MASDLQARLRDVCIVATWPVHSKDAWARIAAMSWGHAVDSTEAGDPAGIKVQRTCVRALVA